ncbi:uncharacterized protein [Setaria viridis]|uniref:TF-B3 domain-containing protein n=1 Tax=Setaria viridis TaxID=4556 RepID=A0A4U6VDI9_SETVI|nr:hypothetical protein SEVIR_3G263800v2 [Setaria viridis]
MDAAGGSLGDDAQLATLRDVLAALGATAPRLVYRKTLHRADVNMNQTRLLIPCRSDDGDASALTAFLTESEKERVREHHEVREGHLYGIEVPVYDRHGWRFGMRLNWTEASRAYRFSGTGWGLFLRDNQLPEAMAAAEEIGRKLEVELWAFRLTELQLQERRAEGDHHPDGVLGVAILIRI